MGHPGARVLSRDELRAIEPPPATAAWKPVKHARVVEIIHHKLQCHEIAVIREEPARALVLGADVYCTRAS